MKPLILFLLIFVSNNARSEEWYARAFNELSGRSKAEWNLLKSDRLTIKREFQGYIEYKTNFIAPTHHENIGIYLGQIGDVDKVFVNDVLIGQTGSFPPNYTYNMDVIRHYFVPNSALKVDGKNELRVLVYSKFLVNKGLDTKNVVIGENSILHREKYSAELFGYLSKIVIPLMCLLLAIISFPFFAPKEQWREQVLISLIGVSGFILGLCRSRIFYHYFELGFIYKVTLTSSILTIWFITVYSIGFRESLKKWVSFIFATIAIGLIVGLSLQDNIPDTYSWGRVWFHFAPIFLLSSFIFVFKSERGSWPLKIGLLTLFLTNLNDILNDLNIISSPQYLQFGIGSFISMLTLNQVMRLKKSWEKYFKKEFELETEAKIGRRSVQIAHDIQSPLDALKAVRDVLKVLPESSRSHVDMAINRIEEISLGLLSDRKSGSSVCREVTHLNSCVDLVVREKVLSYRNYPDLFVNFDSENVSSVLFASIAPDIFKRIVSNIISNSVEAMKYSGTVSISAEVVDGLIKIVLRDSGPGFDMKYSSRVFEKGFTTKEKGNGLGLHSAKEEVQKVGGSISVHTDKGAVVEIFLPLFVHKKVVVIDDDELAHFNWKREGRRSGLDVHSFFGIDQFLEQVHSFDRSTPIYIDSDLGNGVKGEVESIRIFNFGFRNLFISSSYSEDYFENTPYWVSAVLGKSVLYN